jgi:hypothetical protein
VSPVPPLLSVVAASRNDDHGGRLLPRMQLFLDGLLDQAARHRLSGELVLVEWNPPPDRPRLAEALRFDAGDGRFPVRIIEVPAAVHAGFPHAAGLPLFQMIAKNVGIRRARGGFVLATNIDVLLSEPLAARLAAGRLSPGRMYRADRLDAPTDVPADLPPRERTAWCGPRLLRVNSPAGTHPPGAPPPRLPRRPADWLRLLRERMTLRDPPLHTNACGDFTLMHRSHWRAVRGYAEFPMFSFRLDSLLCYCAHYAGAREVRLRPPEAVIHIEHAPGSGWTPGRGAGLLDRRLAAAQVPKLELSEYLGWVNRMRLFGRPPVFNDDRWGLADHDLPETVL